MFIDKILLLLKKKILILWLIVLSASSSRSIFLLETIVACFHGSSWSSFDLLVLMAVHGLAYTAVREDCFFHLDMFHLTAYSDMFHSLKKFS